MMRIILGLLALAAAGPAFAVERAHNVILFLGDAGGIPTLHAASVYGHNDAQALFIQHMPHLALMDTSAADRWVTDSAAGMTALVTGAKTKNSVLSESAAAVPQKADGPALKTILEYAEEHGLSTGVITNVSIVDATPAACFAHVNYRKDYGEIFRQLVHPKFGDGPEVVIGRGRAEVVKATKALGIDADAALREAGYTLVANPAVLPANATRVAAITEDTFAPRPTVERAIQLLARNPKGYFLMVEWDMHAANVRAGLQHVLEMDDLVRQTTQQAGADTLVIFTADHSFDLRMRGGKRGEPLLPPEPAVASETSVAKSGNATIRTDNHFTGEQVAVTTTLAGESVRPMNLHVEDGHTGEQVLVTAQGPGADRLHGFIVNTDLFHLMMSAYGWE